MSGFDGDGDEMPVATLDDRALDALLRGARSSPPGFEWLVPFVDELAAASSGPAPDPQPALVSLLRGGFPGAGVAEVSPQAPDAATFIAKTTRTTLGTQPDRLVRKVAGWRTAVVLGMGVVLAATGMTVAGAAGVLPAPAQHVVATVVEAATPFTFPDATEEKGDVGTKAGTDPGGVPDPPSGTDGRTGGSPATGGPGESPASQPTPTPAPGATTSTDDGQGPGGAGANGGATGLDRAGQTPAAGHVPTDGPPITAGQPGNPGNQGNQGSKGVGTARSTPAAGHVPSSVPGHS